MFTIPSTSTWCLLALLTFIRALCTRQELFTSTDQLLSWPKIQAELTTTLERQLRYEEQRIEDIRQIQLTFQQLYKRHFDDDGLTFMSSAAVLNPVYAFKLVIQIRSALDQLESIVHVANRDFLSQKWADLESRNLLLSNDDVIGSGEALLRLQSFYGLDEDDLIHGRLTAFHRSNSSANVIMNSRDCFELGKVAYERANYSIANEWFLRSLKLSNEYDLDGIDDSSSVDVNEVLEYMAFGAYQDGQIEVASELTKLLLEVDPENERASENLVYYLEELEEMGSVTNETSDHQLGTKKTPSELAAQILLDYPARPNNELDDSVIENSRVRSLCREGLFNGQAIISNRLKCYKRFSILSPNFEVRVEILNVRPEIIRIHNVVTRQEAQHIQRIAQPQLKRSTVQNKGHSTTTDFRIAKSAWISGSDDSVVSKLEERLADFVGLEMRQSEDLQVVNYGLGGFYGPHLDSARRSGMYDTDSLGLVSANLARNDRMATVLIYLNHVEAGGSTVFPRIGLVARPIERSAIIWHNILRNGFSDERTLHTGCPVLLGSKWIATKWPREVANVFTRPCTRSEHR